MPSRWRILPDKMHLTMKLYQIKGDSQCLSVSITSFPFWKRRGEIGVDNLHENVMEDRRGDFAAAAAFLYDADTDKAWIESGESGKRPCMRGSVLVVLRRSGLAENIYTFDS